MRNKKISKKTDSPASVSVYPLMCFTFIIFILYRYLLSQVVTSAMRSRRPMRLKMVMRLSSFRIRSVRSTSPNVEPLLLVVEFYAHNLRLLRYLVAKLNIFLDTSKEKQEKSSFLHFPYYFFYPS